MEHAACRRVRGDLSSVRRRAAAFLDNLPGEDDHGTIARENWITKWTEIGNDQCFLGDLNAKEGACDEATEAWLCALTAFEIARRLADDDDPQCADVSAKIEAGVQRLELSLARIIQRVKILDCDCAELLVYYFSAGGRDLPAPAVICISREEETGATLLGRLLPVVIARGISVLVVSHDEFANHSPRQSEDFFSCCFDYLSARPEIDARRIGVYGEGLSAVLATDFAVFDRRVAAAVCDGGLWNSARTLASVGWMTRTADVVDEDLMSIHRVRLARQLRCPALVVAGGRGIVSETEAINLKAGCAAASIDLELAVSPVSPTWEVENFVTSDDRIFEWLEHKLAAVQLHNL
ncbi:hypothetical protein SAMN05216330_1294 [Bradyrhizobium sp. Ghvi]|uniref:hypothetical protein n=1 Tax=Bradyrhizobium sp. Ghvi TaxID=1855319 RepID=UPI0008E8712E|nr:hypothetical protein [Bradyrhizobium sp. Ghvi]SFQ34094.1 hypothetical protein SAMN05216330_1294 [Bradyrhizobium sp. Ghvi]